MCCMGGAHLLPTPTPCSNLIQRLYFSDTLHHQCAERLHLQMHNVSTATITTAIIWSQNYSSPALQSTYPVCCTESAYCSASICTLRHGCACWWPLPTYYSRLCTWAESTLGAIDGRGQQKCSAYNACGPYQTIQSTMKLVFDNFDGFIMLTSRSDAYM